MKRFYATDISTDNVLLKDEEAQHCIKVLRCRLGESVEVMDGRGTLYSGIIADITKNTVEINQLQTVRKIETNLNKLSIAIAPTKNPARLEWFIEKATEIGIAQIYPILTERTEKTSIKLDRLQNIIISAAKQSGQLYFPSIYPLQTLPNLLNSLNDKFENYFIAHCTEEENKLADRYPKNKTALVLIGPEGDFTPKEIQAALNKNYIPVSLGNSILRVETAGIVACTIAQMIND